MRRQTIPVSGGVGFTGRAFPAVRRDDFRQTTDHFRNLKEF